MKTKWILTMAAAAVMTSPMAWAEDKPPMMGKDGPHPGMMMEKIDANGDGAVSHDEFMQMHEERFKKIDTDGNGSLSPDEMKAAWDEKHEKMKEKRGEWREKRHRMRADKVGGAPVEHDED